MENLVHDLRSGLRQLVRSKGSSTLALVILALGIGGTTAVLAVADRALVHPLPRERSDRLISIREIEMMHDARWGVSPQLIVELSSQTNLLSAVTYFFQSPEDLKLQVAGGTARLAGAKVAPSFFELFGVKPLTGRVFLPGDGSEGADRVVVISQGFWQQHLGADRNALGRSLVLDGVSHTIVGIMPAAFQFPFQPGKNQFWIPHVFRLEEQQGEWAVKNRFWSVIARLKDGVPPAELQALLDTITERRRPSIREPNQRWSIQAEPVRRLFASETLEKTLWVLQATLGALLLITCANVGNLLLARTIGRHNEFGVRVALGAGRARIARQLLTESLVFAGAAAGLGLLVAWGGIRALEQLYLTQLPRVNTLGLDAQAIATVGLLSALAGLLFGVAPALVGARASLGMWLKESAPQHSQGRVQQKLQEILVVVQTSLTVVLLIGAALMIQSVVKLLRTDPGLDPVQLYRAWYDPNPLIEITHPDFEAAAKRGLSRQAAIAEWWPEQVRLHRQWNEQVVERLQSTPGIQAAAINGNSGGAYAFGDYRIDGREDLVQLSPSEVGIVSGDYFRTLRLPLLAGRWLQQQDCVPGETGVVVNQELAKRCWPRQDPIGKRFSSAMEEGGLPRQDYTVVGLVKDMVDWRKDLPQQPTFYYPMERSREALGAGGDFMIRSTLNPEQLRAWVVRLGKEMSPSVELNGFFSIEVELNRSLAPRRVMMWLFLTLGGLGLLLSALGVYAVLSYAMTRRTREIGVRMALGADRAAIVRLVLGRGGRLIVDGLAMGAVVAFALGQYVESLLYQLKPGSFWAFGAALLLMGAVAGVACYLPARRASRLDPMAALRRE